MNSLKVLGKPHISRTQFQSHSIEFIFGGPPNKADPITVRADSIWLVSWACKWVHISLSAGCIWLGLCTIGVVLPAENISLAHHTIGIVHATHHIRLAYDTIGIVHAAKNIR